VCCVEAPSDGVSFLELFGFPFFFFFFFFFKKEVCFFSFWDGESNNLVFPFGFHHRRITGVDRLPFLHVVFSLTSPALLILHLVLYGDNGTSIILLVKSFVGCER
jgi:hypothetical protein